MEQCWWSEAPEALSCGLSVPLYCPWHKLNGQLLALLFTDHGKTLPSPAFRPDPQLTLDNSPSLCPEETYTNLVYHYMVGSGILILQSTYYFHHQFSSVAEWRRLILCNPIIRINLQSFGPFVSQCWSLNWAVSLKLCGLTRWI